MLKKIKQLLFITAILFISGCGTSNISYHNEQLNLQINQAHLQIRGKQLDKKAENFSSLYLAKNLLRLDDGSLIVYEYGRTDMQYQFDTPANRTIRVIFDAKSVVGVYYSSLLHAFQVVLKDNRVLNVLVTQHFDQELDIVYGMSTKKLNSMLKSLDPNAQPVRYNNVIDLSKEPTPFVSRWTDWKVHFYPLIVPLRRIGRL